MAKLAVEPYYVAKQILLMSQKVVTNRALQITRIEALVRIVITFYIQIVM